MCGIGGIFCHPDKSIAHTMNSIQRHRGPDGHEVYSDDNIALAHTRLAIVDIDGSHQPLKGPSQEILVVNGEIYNHGEIRSHHKHYPWTTKGDSEAILALFTQSKLESNHTLSAQDHSNWISKLDGMYAFALWDPTSEHLILARDPLGIKPLVRTQHEGSMLFSSEHKGLRADERHIPEIDHIALSARLAWEYPLDATTLLKEVYQVRPGTVEVWAIDQQGNAQLFDTAIHHQTTITPLPWDPLQDAHRLLESFTVSVEQRLMSDVPVGIVLSGGLDSSLVAAVADEAAHRAQQPVPECWTVAESEDNPDYVAAELVASSFNLTHHQHIIEREDLDGAIQNLVWHGEDLDVTVAFFQPLFQHMNQHVTVGLCGQGADELHGGYPRYKNIPDHLQLVAQRLESIRRDDIAHLSSKQWGDDPRWYAEHHSPYHMSNSLNDFLEFELNHGQLSNFQLRLVDRHSMAHSLEVRVPFLGSSHRTSALQLPEEWKLPATMEEKLALRKASSVSTLPTEIVNRPKLPAGTATTPTLLASIVDEYQHQISDLCNHYKPYTDVLKHQKELALGLGLFEAMHIIDEGRTKKTSSIDQLVSEVLL